MTTKYPKNSSKNQYQPKMKMILAIKSTFLGKKQEKKTPKSNSPHEIKLIIVNNEFFFTLEFSEFLSSIYKKKELKNKKNQV